jgi:hypothetical protein
LLNIDSALTLIRLPRRDDPDDFFAIFVLTIGVHDQENSPRNASDRMPSLFAFDNAVLNQNYVRIVEDTAAVSKSKPLCFAWLIRLFPSSHSKRIVIQNV